MTKKDLIVLVATNLTAALVLLICGLLLGWHLGVTRGYMVVKKRGYAKHHAETGELVWVDDGTLVRESK